MNEQNLELFLVPPTGKFLEATPAPGVLDKMLLFFPIFIFCLPSPGVAASTEMTEEHLFVPTRNVTSSHWSSERF